MKNEIVKTALWAGAALALVVAAVSVEPGKRSAEVFSDQGEALFERFRNLDAARSIEVIDYDETQAVARPLKAEFRQGRWMLSSHYDYPAEARDRLAKTAAALLDLKKDVVASDRFEDHAQFGVVDPLDAKVASLQGRGKRVTLRDAAGAALADLVLGHAVKDKPGYRYLRLPGQKRVYSVKTEADPSARFEDWVESNLLRLSSAQLKRVVVISYSLDEQSGRLANLQRIVAVKAGDGWKQESGPAVAPARIQSMVSALAGLRPVGARPKPKDLAQQLRSGGALEMTLDSMMSLRQRGYFITPDGRLLANEGEVVAETESGVTFNLRFGEIVTGSGDAKPASVDPTQAQQVDRFLFVSSSDPALRAKFADWYYVIRGSDFTRLRLKSDQPASSPARPGTVPGSPVPVPERRSPPPSGTVPPRP